MSLLGLDPRSQQDQQRRDITVQSQHWEDELTKMLQRNSQTQQQPFSSPWQVAGQMAQALSGRMHAGQNAQNYANLNANLVPDTGGQPSAPSAAPGAPQSPGAPDLGSPPSNAPAASPAAPQGAPKHGGTPFSPEVKQAIREGAQLAGVDPSTLAVFAHIESDGDPNAKTGHYKGLMQLGDDEMARVSGGQGNVWNPRDSARAAGLIVKENSDAFKKFTGRDPSPFDQYGMHQQGRQGYFQHIGNPDELAWKNMLSTAEGRQKGPEWAKAAITGNGGKLTDTSGQFIGRWHGKFDRMAAGDMNAFQPGQGQPGAPAAPTSGQPGAGAVPPQGAGGGSLGIEQGQFVDPSRLPPRPAPTYTEAQIGKMAGSGQLSPQQVDQAIQEIRQASQPMSIEVPGGKLMYDPRNPSRQMYVPTVQTKTIKVGDIETPQQFWLDSKGNQRVVGQGGQGGAPGAAASPVGSQPGSVYNTPAPPSLGAAISSGNIDQLSAAGIARDTEKEQRKGLAAEATKVYAGAHGLGLTGGKIQSLANDILPIISSPGWASGTSGEVRQGLNRLAANIGVDPNANKPVELVQQAVGMLRQYLQDSLKTGTSILGEQAPRVFQTEVENIDKITPSLELKETQAGLIGKVKSLARLGGHWAENSDLVDDYVAKNRGLPDIGLNKLLRDRERGFHMIAPNEEPQPAGAAGKPGNPPPEGATKTLRFNREKGKLE